MINLLDELEAVVAELEAHSADYALCGAFALAVHGVPRATKDIDLLVRPEQLDRVRAAAKKCGYVFEALPITFSSGIRVQRFTKLVEGRPVMLDALLVNEVLEPIWAAREKLTWQRGEVWSVSRDGLITLKITAGRPQDLADVQALGEMETKGGSS
jgi:hypothetical protein